MAWHVCVDKKGNGRWAAAAAAAAYLLLHVRDQRARCRVAEPVEEVDQADGQEPEPVHVRVPHCFSVGQQLVFRIEGTMLTPVPSPFLKVT